MSSFYSTSEIDVHRSASCTNFYLVPKTLGFSCCRKTLLLFIFCCRLTHYSQENNWSRELRVKEWMLSGDVGKWVTPP